MAIPVHLQAIADAFGANNLNIGNDALYQAFSKLAYEYADRPEELEEFLKIMVDSGGDISRITGVTHTPVDIDTFIDDPYFLNLKCRSDGTPYLYPEVRRFVKQVVEGGYVEAMLLGAVGVGKTTAAQIITAYHLYQLSCERWPQLRFGLMPSSTIYIAMLNRTDTLAERVTYGEFRTLIENIPYFKQNYPFDKDIKSELHFLKGNIKVIPSAAFSGKLLGMNIISAICDEMNFFQHVEKSKQSNTGGEFDQAKAIYSALVRRRKSRFLEGGKLPGCLCIVSSKGGPDDFTEQRLKEVETEEDGLTAVFNKAQWEVVPLTRFRKERFFLEVGDERHNSRVIEDREEAREGATVLEVPIDFKRDFERDMDGSLRDYAGISTLSERPFFYDREKIWKMAENFENSELMSPFTITETTLEYGLPEIRPDYIVPNPEKIRVAHIDLAVSGDSCGIAVGYVYSVNTVRGRGAGGAMVIDDLPVVAYDVVLRVNAPRGGEIDFEQVRNIIYLLRDVAKLDIRIVTFDQFQSVDSRQIMKKRGFLTDHLSVDGEKGRDAYMSFRSAVFNERVLCPEHPHAFRELSALEQDPKKGTVDHPASGGKDCIAGDTLIPLLNGTAVPIRELVGKEVEVYSSTASGRMLPALARNIHRIGECEVVRVHLDSGDYLDCTPDHEIMLRDGSFIQAEDLKEGASLMPFYREVSIANAKSGLNGYEKVWCNETQKWVFTHQRVGEEIHGFKYGASKEGRKVLHHIDFNKRNNASSNLRVMAWDEHRDLHNHVGTTNLKKLQQDPAFRERQKIRSSKIGKITGPRNLTKYNKSPERVKKLHESGLFSANGKKVMTRLWADPEYRERHMVRVSGDNSHWTRTDITLGRIVEIAKTVDKLNDLYAALQCTQKVVYRVLRENGRTPKDLKKAITSWRLYNHKVARVEKLDKKTDVYDMTVDGIHNFAIVPGIFVHNCADSMTGVFASLMKRKFAWKAVNDYARNFVGPRETTKAVNHRNRPLGDARPVGRRKNPAVKGKPLEKSQYNLTDSLKFDNELVNIKTTIKLS